ncbi:MAG TPA: hypothetical protein PK357_02775 [Candidatus Pacearchaeota archaeon]|nr:hypothetical protein [Candidatus Pacearchaeota archaeon]
MTNKGLIEIVTLEDIDGFLFNRRNDTQQIVYRDDLELIKQIDITKPVGYLSRSNGKIYFPEEAVPKEANSIAYLRSGLSEGEEISSQYFCKLKLREDDGFRRLIKCETIQRDFSFRGNFQIDNTNISIVF